MDPIYLDYNATTPIDPEVAEAMRPYLTGLFGNPSSPHPFGLRVRDDVETARGRVARFLGAAPAEIVFTSGGTELNNMAIRGVARACRSRGRHIVTSAMEHPAVTEVLDWLAGEGFVTTRVPVDDRGFVDPDAVARAITDETILVSVMHANNEVGSIQPIRAIADLARARGVLVHTDAAQSTGKIPVNVDELGVDLLSVAGHKLYGPKGVGALYIRSGTEIERLLHGANQEAGRRAGTENTMLVAGLGRACERAGEKIDERASHMRSLRDRLWEGLSAGIPGLVRHGDPARGLPNTLSVAVPGREAASLLAAVPDVAASAGAACHSGCVSVSATLAAMRVEESVALGTIRFSTGALLTEGDVDRAVAAFAAAAARP